MMEAATDTGYIDIPEVMLPFVEERARYKIAYGGRGSAKSWTVARALLRLAQRDPLKVLCTREIQRTIKDSVHAVLAGQIKTLGMDGFYRVTEKSITGLNGSEFIFAGLRDMDIAKIKSLEGIDIAWAEEAQVITERSWRTLAPTIRKPGSEIWVTFNPELDTDPTYVRFVANPPPGAIVIRVNHADNPWFPDVLEQERQVDYERDQTPDKHVYAHVWEGRCLPAVEGAIYHHEVAAMLEDKRYRPVPYDPMLKVHTVWDLGWADQTSIILGQRQGSEIRVIGYLEESFRTYDQWVAELALMKMNWGSDWLPHDAWATSQQTGQSPAAILSKLGRRVQKVPNLAVEHGIKAARQLFPQVYMAEGKCERLLHCLQRYRRRVHQVTGTAMAPEHDEYSHGADAFRYMALAAEKWSNESWDDQPLKYDSRGIV